MDEYSSTPAIEFLKKFGLVILLGIFGVGSLVYGLMQYAPHSENPDISFDSPEPTSTPQIAAKIMVDISGEVNKPGVYAFATTSRIIDAIEKAGGLSKSADRTYVAKSINAAMKLSDGMKIYIPKVGESISKTQVANGTTSNVAGTGQTNGTSILGAQTGLISINTATESELDSLPGVGTVTAGKIMNGRPYGSVEELLSKKVITSSVYGKIKEKISL